MVQKSPLDLEGNRKGGVFVGILHKGNATKKLEIGSYPRSSIPSTYEAMTVLTSREKDGFNTRTSRFNKYVNTLPGPGYYHSPSSLVNTTGSISCKGYSSGFVSKARRFSNEMQRQMGSPGPGEYLQRTGRDVHNDKYFNKSNTTAVFSKSVENLVPHKSKITQSKSSPGPGAYELADVSSSRNDSASVLSQNSSLSAFKSSTKRFGSKSTKGAAPGQYTLPDTFKVQEKKYTAFKHSTGRYQESKKNSKSKLDNLNIFKPTENRNGLEERPGPGTYEVGVNDLEGIQASKPSGKYSSIFGRTTTDRFGHPIQPKIGFQVNPGPGQYLVGGNIGRSKGVTSVFISSTDRNVSSGIYKSGEAPGPCLYNPIGAINKTFHLNTKKRWM